MRSEETCPTCGSKLGPLHEREVLRRCDACQQLNPRGFRYCGFCAAPIESEGQKAERAEIAAPAGGWPSLARELVELRFYLDRGELDEAYELLSILHQRHPGHPALQEFERQPETNKPRPDTQVYRVVDAVLAESSSLTASSLPRRAVPQWNAPVVDDGEEGKKTRAHAPVPLGAEDDEPTNRRLKVAEPKKSAPAGRARTDKHLGAVPVTAEPAVAKRGKRGTSGAVPKAGLTVAVPTLQPPKPFEGTTPAVDEVDEDARPTKVMSAKEGPKAPPGDALARGAKESPKAARASKKVPAVAPEPAKKPAKGAVRKRMLEPELAVSAKAVEPKKRSGKHAAVPKPAEPEPGKKRSFGARFGQGVLGRLGGKGKG